MVVSTLDNLHTQKNCQHVLSRISRKCARSQAGTDGSEQVATASYRCAYLTLFFINSRFLAVVSFEGSISYAFRK